VADQDRAIEFYIEKLDFEKRVDVPFGNGDRWLEVAPGDAVTTIALAPPPRARRRATARLGSVCRPTTSTPTTRSSRRTAWTSTAEVSRMAPVPPLFWLRDPLPTMRHPFLRAKRSRRLVRRALSPWTKSSSVGAR